MTTYRYAATLDTMIHGRHYYQGNSIDITGWTRKQILETLNLGVAALVEVPTPGPAYALTPTYFLANGSKNIAGANIGTPTGVGALTVVTGPTVISGGLDEITFLNAGLVHCQLQYWISDTTMPKRGYVTRGGAIVGTSMQYVASDIATMAYIGQVAAGDSVLFEHNIAASGNFDSTFTVQGTFFPA